MHSPLRTKAFSKVLKKLDHLEQNWKENPVVLTPSSMENILFQQRVERISNLTLPVVEEEVKLGLLELQQEVFPQQQTQNTTTTSTPMSIPSSPIFDSPTTYMLKKKHHVEPKQSKPVQQSYNLFETIFTPTEIQTILQRILLYCPVSVFLYLKHLITSHQYVKIQDMFLKRIPRKKNSSNMTENDLWAQQFANYSTANSGSTERKEVVEKPESPFKFSRFLRGLKNEKMSLVFLGLERLGMRKYI